MPHRISCVMLRSSHHYHDGILFCFSVQLFFLFLGVSAYWNGYDLVKANNCKGHHAMAHGENEMAGEWWTQWNRSLFHFVFNASWKLNAFSQSSLSPLCQFHEHLRLKWEIETKSTDTKIHTKYYNIFRNIESGKCGESNLIFAQMTKAPEKKTTKKKRRTPTSKHRILMNYNHKFSFTMRTAKNCNRISFFFFTFTTHQK